jgi:uncharacterized integral membrane protein
MAIMRFFLAWPFVTLMTLFILSFALTNRQEIVLGLFPFPIDVTVPLFLPIMIASLLGLWIGLIIGWFQTARQNRLLHQQEKLNSQLSSELSTLREKVSQGKTITSQPIPLLTVPKESRL